MFQRISIADYNVDSTKRQSQLSDLITKIMNLYSFYVLKSFLSGIYVTLWFTKFSFRYISFVSIFKIFFPGNLLRYNFLNFLLGILRLLWFTVSFSNKIIYNFQVHFQVFDIHDFIFCFPGFYFSALQIFL